MNKYRRLFLLGVSALLSWQYVLAVSPRMNLEYPYVIRPFVYRQLIPQLAEMFGVSFSLLIFASCLGVAVLMLQIRDEKIKAGRNGDYYFLASFSAFLMIILVYAKIYDAPTGFLYTLMIVLWMRDRLPLSLAVFALLCLNRETGVLLLPVFALSFWKRIGIVRTGAYLAAMSAIYLSIRRVLVITFEDVYGQQLFWTVKELVESYSKEPQLTALLFLTMSAWVLIAVTRNTDVLLRSFLAIVPPILIVSHILFGVAWEIRVFAEFAPVALILLCTQVNPGKFYTV